MHKGERKVDGNIKISLIHPLFTVICPSFCYMPPSFLPSLSICHVHPKSVLVILIPMAATTELEVSDQFKETYFNA